MRITSKGQVTIPTEIREQMGLLPHTEVEFVVSGKNVVLRKVSGERSRGERLIDSLRGTATTGMSTDEIMALTRGE